MYHIEDDKEDKEDENDDEDGDYVLSKVSLQKKMRLRTVLTHRLNP